MRLTILIGLLFSTISFSAITVMAQGAAPSNLGEADKSLAPEQSTAQFPATSRNKEFSLPTFSIEPRGDRKWTTFDRHFIVLNALSTLALAADLRTTIHGLNSNPNLRELNPLFGTHPSVGRLLGVAIPIHCFATYEIYRAKRYGPRRGVWKVGPRVSIVAHSLAALNNLVVARMNSASPSTKH